jgi:hypothetical protein
MKTIKLLRKENWHFSTFDGGAKSAIKLQDEPIQLTASSWHRLRQIVDWFENGSLFRAYIAANEHSIAFDSAMGQTAASAMAAVKRQNSPDWQDCYVWCVYVHKDGQEETL